MKGRVPGDIFQKLWPADQKLASKATGVESFHQQLEQPRICHQELKEQAAQTIRLYEPDELIQSCIRISRLCQPFD